MRRITLIAVVAAFLGLLAGGCGHDSVEKTRNGLIVNMEQDAPAPKMRITVFNEKVLGVITSSKEGEWDDTPAFFLFDKGIDTPFRTEVNETTASVFTSIAGLKVDRRSSELIFTDSIGNVLLTLIPGEIATSSLGSALMDQVGDFKLLFSQADTLVPDSLSTPIDTVANSAAMKIATDGYNVLWKGNDDGAHEEFFIVFGETINGFASASRINP